MRRPRQGTALQHLYRHHIEAMTLDAWFADMERRCGEQPDDVILPLLAGLMALEHGDTGRARDWLARAVELRPGAWYPRYSLAMAAMQERRFEEVIRHLVAALERTSVREDRLAAGRPLVRAYLRAARYEEAVHAGDQLMAWSEQDSQVIQDLAELFYEEDRADVARRYFDALIAAPDVAPYDRIVAELRRADLLAQSGGQDEALAGFEEALDKVHSDSWLYHEIWARVDTLFRRRDDMAGLLDFYRRWLEKNPSSLDVRLRLADVLVWSDALDEAAEALAEARSRAPHHAGVLERVATTAARRGDYPAAIDAMEEVVRRETTRAEPRIALARFWLSRADHPEAAAEAERWVASIADADPQDPALAIRAADALCELGLDAAAEPFYRGASALAPDVLDYHAYLAEYLLGMGRRDEALAALEAMVEGDRRTPANLMRLADRLVHHGEEEAGLAAAREAVAGAPEDFSLGSSLVRHLEEMGLNDAALARLDGLAAIAPNAFFVGELQETRVRLLSKTGALATAYDALCERLDAEPEPAEVDGILAARMALGLRDPEAARRWIDRVMEDGDAPDEALSLAERVYIELGDVEGQVALLEAMIARDPARSAEVLRRLVQVYQRMADIDRAIETAERMIDAMPASPAGYQVMARLQQSMGDSSAAMGSLRRALALAPDDVALRIELGSLYAGELMLAEAMETYWQVMDLAEDVAEQLAVVRPLMDLYGTQMRVDQFIDRLKRRRNQARDPLGATLVLVSALEAMDDLPSARRYLAALAARFPGNEDVLRQLVSLSRREGDLRRALRYQEDLTAREPSRRNYRVLGDLHLEMGEREAAFAAWKTGMENIGVSDERALGHAFEWVRQLQHHGYHDEALAVLDDLRRRSGDGWRVMYRIAVAHAEADQYDLAFPIFRDLVLRADLAAPAGGGPAGTHHDRFPPEHIELSALARARFAVFQASGQRRASRGADGPDTPERMRALALAHLALMEGESTEVAAWMADLRVGSRADRHLLLAIAFIIQETPYTRAISREMHEAYPDDPFARYLMMTPSRAHAQHGMEDAFMVQVREQLAWFRERRPEHTWFYDWHELRCLVMNDNRDEMERVAQRLVERGRTDPFVLAESMLLMNRGKLHDAFAESIDGALAYYHAQGSLASASQLLRSLGQMAIELVNQPASTERAFGLFGSYLDATSPSRNIAMGQGPSRSLWTGATLDQWLAKPFPQPNRWWNSSRINLLNRMYRNCLNAGEEGALMQFLEDRRAASTAAERITEGLAIGYLQWWQGDEAGALDTLSSLAAEHPALPPMQFTVAHLLDQVGRYHEALARLGALDVRYGPEEKMLRQWILRLALEVGDDAAALAAADELAEQRLSAEACADLADAYLSLGHGDIARGLEKRAERLQGVSAASGAPATGRLGDRVDRMRTASQRGDIPRAVLAARQILRTPRPPNGSKEDPARREAVNLLKREGVFDEVVADAEARRRASPASRRTIEELLDLYHLAGRTDAVRKLLDESMPANRGVAEIRLDYARTLFDEKSFAQAADQLQVIAETDPGVLFGPRGTYWLLSRGFVQAGRTDELVDVMRAITADQVVSGVRSLRLHRDQVAGNLQNFARDTLGQESIPPEVSLRACELAGALVPRRTRNAQTLAQLYQLRGQALTKMDRHEEAFAALLAGVVDDPFFEALSLSVPGTLVASPFHGMTWNRESVDALLLQCLAAADTIDRLGDIERVAAARIEQGDAGFGFLHWCALVGQGRTNEVVAGLDDALSESSMVQPGRNRAWGETMIAVVGGEMLNRHGFHDLAIDVWERVLLRVGSNQVQGIEDNVLRYIVSACEAHGTRARARDILLRRAEHQLADILLPSMRSALNTKIQRALTAMEQLDGLGYSLDALGLAQRILHLPADPAIDPARRRAEKTVDSIRKGKLGGTTDAERLALLETLEADVAARPDDTRAWERLLWLHEAGDDADAAAAVRARMRVARPREVGALLILARSAADAGAHGEAADNYLAVAAEEPERLLMGPGGLTPVIDALVRADRKGELGPLVASLPFDEVVRGSGVRQPEVDRRINQLVQVAHHAMKPEVAAPDISLVLAQSLYRALGPRVRLGSHRDILADIMMQAIHAQELSDDEQWNAYLPLVESHTVVQAIHDAPDDAVVMSSWTLGLAWNKFVVEGLLGRCLDLAEHTSRLRAWLAACEAAIEAGEASHHFTAALLRTRIDPDSLTEEILDPAIAAAAVHRSGPGERALLLGMLGQELMAVNRPEDATRVYARAVELAIQSMQQERAVQMLGALTAGHIAANQPDRARAAAAEAMWPRSRAVHASQDADQQASFHMAMARLLHEHEFYADAWGRAQAAIQCYPGKPHHRSAREAQSFVRSIMEKDLEAMQRRGQLDPLLAKLDEEIAASARAIGPALQKAELLRATGRIEEAAGVLAALNQRRPHDPDVQEMLARILWDAGDNEGALPHALALFAGDPARLLADEDAVEATVAALCERGEFLAAVRGVTLRVRRGDIPGRVDADRQMAVARSIIAMIDVARREALDRNGADATAMQDAALSLMEALADEVLRIPQLASLKDVLIPQVASLYETLGREDEVHALTARRMLGRDVCEALGLPPALERHARPWLGLAWTEHDGLDGSLRSYLGAARERGELDALLEACRVAIAEGDSAGVFALHQAVAVEAQAWELLNVDPDRHLADIGRAGASPTQRVRWLVDAGDALLRAGRAFEADVMMDTVVEYAADEGLWHRDTSLIHARVRQLRERERHEEALAFLAGLDVEALAEKAGDTVSASRLYECNHKVASSIMAYEAPYRIAAMRLIERMLLRIDNPGRNYHGRRFISLRDQLVSAKLPAAAGEDPEAFKRILAELAPDPDGGAADPERTRAWFWAKASMADETELQDAIDEVARLLPGDIVFGLDVAALAADRGAWSTAWRHYGRLVDDAPGLVLADRRSSRNLASAAARVDQLDDLVQRIREQLLPAVMAQPEGERLFRQVLVMANRLTHPDHRRYRAAHRILYETAEWADGMGIPEFVEQTQIETDKMIADLPASGETATLWFRRLATPAMLAERGLPAHPGPSRGLVTAWTWYDHSCTCLWGHYLDLAEEQGILAELAALCEAVPAGDRTDEALWSFAASLRARAAGGAEEAERGAAALAVRDGARPVEERVRLLTYLGLQLSAAGADTAAEAWLDEARRLAATIGPSDEAIYCTLYYARQLSNAGNLEEAEVALLTAPWGEAPDPESLGDEDADLWMKFHYKAAVRLEQLGLLDAAGTAARRVLAFSSGRSRSYYHGKAADLLASMEREASGN